MVTAVDEAVNGDAVQASWGMYGFGLLGLEDPGRILSLVPERWPRIEVVQTLAGPHHRRPAALTVGVMRFDDTGAEIWISDDESIILDRATMQAQLTTHAGVSDDAIAHPYLGLPAAVANRWEGRQILHGGAFFHRGAGWGVLGTKEAGKSSTLGWLQQREVDVLSDDLLIAHGTTMFAGPRCVDLREGAAAVLGGRDVGVLGGRHRWRLSAGSVPAWCPLGGLIYLEWGDEVAVHALAPSERLIRLFEHVVFGPDSVDSVAYLELAGLPAWRFVRPPSLDGFDAALDQLLAAVG